VAKKEGLTLPQPLADRIAAAANRDMRRALLSLEVQPCSSTSPWRM
jgi:DNA polymerase III delta prime subunit